MNRLKRSIKDQTKRALFHVFEQGQHLGVDILPRHFYSQIPDLRVLRAETEWKKPRDMSSIRGHEIASQLQFAESVCTSEIIRTAIDADVHAAAGRRNGEEGYGPVEAIFLYAFIRKFRPARVVQVGCGVSTAVMLAAAADARTPLRITCIDPYPTGFLREASRAGEIELVEGPAQRFVQEAASTLGAGDLLFVDSTHTVMPGSEVNVVILDVLPRLAPGVLVHFHDITFPYDYQRGLLKGNLFCQAESTLLHAFLSCNDRYELLASMSMLHYAASARLQELIPSYGPGGNDEGLETTSGHFPSALYLRRL
jgi:predicted O-methyltransferase YrrM